MLLGERRKFAPPRFLVSVLLLGLGLPLLAEEPPRQGFREAVFSVGNLEEAVELYRRAAGWEVLWEGKGDTELSRFWGLDEGVTIHQVLMRNPGTHTGFLRLVRFDGVDSEIIRSSAQSWDTGGIFDVNLRVHDIEATFRDFQNAGWIGTSDPQEFTFGPFVVREVLVRGPDGVVLAMIQRLAPPLEGWPHLRKLSRIFNATQVVRDFDRSFDFYKEKLGFQVYLEHEGASKEPGANVLGLPHNLTDRIPRKVAILSPDGRNSGSVEILSFEGLTGADFSARAKPPNRGVLLLRFPVPDLEAYRQRLESHGVPLVTGPQKLTLPPYGTAKVLAVQAPEGAWLEFMELEENGNAVSAPQPSQDNSTERRAP